tara:strand:- start:429 stop:2273 length:1845 start_codon:yes stop_codon:yes gene_type:complete
MDQKQPPPPETWGGLLTSMGGAEDRLDSMPDTETTTVIKESLDPEIATTKTTTIKGDPSWKGSAAFADQDVGMGGGGPFIGLGDPRNVRAGPDMPPGYAPNPAYAPPGSSPSMNVDWSKIRASQRPGHVPPVNPYDFVGEPGGGQQVPGQLDLGLPPQFQADLDEQARRGFPPIQKQIKPEESDSIATGPTDAMIEERFGRETAMIPNSERSIGGRVMEPNPQFVDPRIVALNEQEPRTDIGYELPRQVTEGVGEGDVLDTRPRGTMGEGGLTQGIGELPKINNTAQADRNKMRENPNLEQIWGKYAYDPAARKKAYLDNLKKIYRKAMLLDAIAALTGGESRSKQYLQMATGRLDAIDKFDEEERVSNIWREVFTNDEGKFDMPASKTEAARRAAQLGASPKTIKDIFGSISEEKKRDQYFKVDPNDPAKWEIKRFDSDPGEEWIRGTPTATSPVKDKSTYHIKNLRHWESLKKTDPELADSFGRQIGAIPRDKTITPSKWASIIAQDISTGRIELPAGMTGIQFIQDFLTNDEVEYVGEDGETTTLPGYNKWMGKQPTKDEVESAVKESGGEDGEGEKGAAPQVAIDALKADPTEEKKKMFKDKYGYLPKEI